MNDSIETRLLAVEAMADNERHVSAEMARRLVRALRVVLNDHEPPDCRNTYWFCGRCEPCRGKILAALRGDEP